MQPRKRACEAEGSAADAPRAIRLTGGHAEKSRTVAAYRAGQHVDVDVHSADGFSYRAHGLVLMAGSDYFAAVYSGGWADATGPHVLGEMPAEALEACIEWIYTGSCLATDDRALHTIVEAATYLQISSLVEAAFGGDV